MKRTRLTRALLTVAQTGQAQMAFGNLYEAVVKVPHRFATHRDLVDTPLLRPGSPTLYFVPSGPIAIAAAVAALGAGWRGPFDRRWLAVSSGASVAAAAQTVYVVREINTPLFFDAAAPAPERRDVLLRRWYRLNALRILTAGLAWYGAQRARRAPR